MLMVKSNPLELRGIAHKTTKQNKVYYVVNCEEEDGTARSFYCPDSKAFSADLKKAIWFMLSLRYLITIIRSVWWSIRYRR